MGDRIGASATRRIVRHLTWDPRVNLALQQNAVPVVHELRLENPDPEPLEDLTLAVWAEPDLCARWERRLARLEGEATWDVGIPDLSLPPQRLANLVEREVGRLCLEVSSQGEVLLSETHPLELLAYNEWGGTRSLPESLAAFVMPNHPAVETLLRQARQHLERWTKNPAFEGYQGRDPNRARLQAAAIFSAIADLDITYVGLPASFEKSGQKVRTPDQLLEARMGNCLDLTLLMAAAMEQAGLHPLLVLVQGHAFPGVWLEERSLPQPIGDDPLSLRKRAEVGEMAFFDSSAAASRPRVSFEQAEEVARKALGEVQGFEYAVDVKASRHARIRPLPIRLKAGGGFVLPEPEPAPAPAAPLAPAALRGGPAREASSRTREIPERRLERWRSKLLDLSLRNRLLNYRPGAKCVPLLCPDLAVMEDGLAGEVAFQILPRPDRRGEARNLELHQKQTGEDLEGQFLAREMKASRLYADLAPADLSKRLVQMFRESRANLEETGANTLYLALGFLEWFESPSSTTARRAPILLLPMQIVRGAVSEPFRIRLAEDEPRLNSTLLEKMKRDFGIEITTLDELPQDESGLDIPLIFDTFRRAVLEMPRWQVVEEAHLGHFSFAKFLMWLDLAARQDQLMGNAAVRHLVESGANPLPPVDFMTPQQVDERPPGEVFCPLDADSSQLAAVFAAEKGNSFVLQGPPGTGKSQTITNLVAHSLAHGRSVLFVSEKRAALEVVFRRLGAIGLAPFCLELHSNKTNKADIFRQLQEALDFTGAAPPRDWEIKARQLQELRTQLNGYVQAAHDVRLPGLSVYQVTSELIGLRQAPLLRWTGPEPDRLEGEVLAAMRTAVDRLATASQRIGNPQEHPWWGVGWTGWSPLAEKQVAEELPLVLESVGRLQSASDACATALGLPQEAWSRSELDWLEGLVRDLLTSPSPPLELLNRPRWKEVRLRVEEILEHVPRRRETWRGLSGRYGANLLELPLEDLLRSFRQSLQTNALFGLLKLWNPRRLLGKVALGKPGASAEVILDLESALEVVAEDRWLGEVAAEARSLLGQAWKGAETDSAQVDRLLDWSEGFRRHLLRAEERFPSQAQAVAAGLARLAAEAEERLDPDRAAGKNLRAFLYALESWREAREGLVGRLQIDEARAWTPEAGFLSRMGQRLQSWSQRMAALRDWSACQSACAEARGLGLSSLLEAYEQGRLEPGGLMEAFLRSFYEEWFTRVLSQDERLREFRGLEHQRKVERFRELDRESLSLMQQAVVARLAARVPDRNVGASVNGSEMHLLTRELTKKRRHLPCRKLFERLPNLLARLKPCVLMSPLSVAQYLDPGLPPYDLIVFDEASQIPVWDAIGAIARGSQVVVVGDSKQLPPTSFFCIGDSEDDVPDEDNIEEAESILDECEATAMPRHPLTWHYRSRHEDLIAFSNQHYYDSRLNTFPCADAEVEHLGVHWRHVPGGFFERGGSRTNRAEAEAVVAEVVARLRDPRRQNHSIGVVTFNQTQQNLVEDLLEVARARHPEIEPFFGNVEEPVFVKNLENVQGDERDAILFSVAYGPDQVGKVSMNFGPLNRDGGERRLNVAITRAREQLVVFSTLQPDMIDLARTSAKGVAHFKRFLDFARRGPQALAEAKAVQAAAERESPFEETVARELEERGWSVRRQVGSSGFRVDLAVLDPERPGSYLLGVECDGANYQASRAARDRDRLRQAVLNGLGWRLHRVWSSDWWFDPAREIERLEEALRQAGTQRPASGSPASGDSSAASVGAPPAPLPVVPEAVHEPQATGAYQRLGGAANPGGGLSAGSVSAEGSGRPAGTFGGAAEGVASPAGASGSLAGGLASPAGGPSVSADGPCLSPGGAALPAGVSSYTRMRTDLCHGQPEAFYEALATAAVQASVRQVLEKEAPIPFKELARRVGALWGLQKVTSRLESRLKRCLGREMARVVEDTVWRPDQDPASWRGYRLSPPGEEARDLEGIPLAELANAAEALLEQCCGLAQEDLVRGTAQLFGFSRLGKRLRERLDQAVDLLAAQSRCQVEDGNVSLPR